MTHSWEGDNKSESEVNEVVVRQMDYDEQNLLINVGNQ